MDHFAAAMIAFGIALGGGAIGAAIGDGLVGNATINGVAKVMPVVPAKSSIKNCVVRINAGGK